MDLFWAVVLGNCTISICCWVLRGAIIRCRRGLVVVADYCDRWRADCGGLAEVPESLAACRRMIRQVRSGYAQQSITIDRVRTIGLSIGIARSLLANLGMNPQANTSASLSASSISPLSCHFFIRRFPPNKNAAEED